ncbi:MAG: hypothetical protein EXR71_04095 [Myxococcales bacterium]|nr:hypothetical protein [Myxococcales bacterium]
MFIFVVSLASASSLAGDLLELHYGSTGAWSDDATGVGLKATLDGTPVEFLYAGDIYQLTSLAYRAGDDSRSFAVGSSVGSDLIVDGGEDLSSGSDLAMSWTYRTGELEIVRTESFDEAELALVVAYAVTNLSPGPVEELRLLFAMDPDQDVVVSANYSTLNSVEDVNADGVEDWVQAVGPDSGVVLGIGACAPEALALGFYSAWSGTSDVDVGLIDPAGASGDDAMALRWTAPEALGVGESMAFRFVVSVDTTTADAVDNFLDLAAEACCDGDSDGVTGEACGGEDCDDLRPDVLPGAPDAPYDGIDQDCTGSDVADLDGDGEYAVEAGGRDCDDADAGVWSGQAEVWYDGIDQNCDGNDDDQDLDGYVLAFDCDDMDPALWVDCPTPDTDDGSVDASSQCGCSAAAAGGPSALVALVGTLMRRRRRGR